jgi:hypothetical protein
VQAAPVGASPLQARGPRPREGGFSQIANIQDLHIIVYIRRAAYGPPLMAAASTDKVPIVSDLLRLGVDANTRDRDVPGFDRTRPVSHAHRDGDG